MSADPTESSGRGPALALQQVSVQFGSVRAVSAVDLEVMPGELVAVTGRSGSGKSTLLNVAAGLVPATSGSVLVAGQSTDALKSKQLAEMRRRHVGFVFQSFNLIPSLTAGENVSLPLELDGVGLDEAARMAAEALAEVGLGPAVCRFPDELSGGEQQRVAIARGLIGSRSLLLADEPTAALDDLTAEDIMGLLRRKCEGGAAALMVTHDAGLAAWADRVVRLRDGVVEQETSALSGLSIEGMRS